MSRNQNGFTLIEVALSLTIIVILFFVFFRGFFVNSDIAARALEKQGYEDVQIMEKAWLLIGLRGCDGKDAAKFVAKVTNPAKKSAEVYVCVGWPFKGATIRTD